MRRYRGDALPDRPRVAVVSNDAIGNYLVVTPLLQMLRAAHNPSSLAYFGGSRSEELWSREPMIDCGAALFGSEPRDLFDRIARDNPYDLVVNVEVSAFAKCVAGALAAQHGFVCGPCVGLEGRGDLPFTDDPQGALWQDSEWVSEDLPERYPFLHSGFIGELFCRLAYLEGEVPAYRVPCEPWNGATLPDIFIAMSASLESKLWSLESWRSVLRGLKDRRVGLLGAKPSSQSRYWTGASDEQTLVEEGLVEDWRGAFTLPQVVGAIGAAKAVLTLDNGIMHLAAAAGTPTVALFRDKIFRLWAPPVGSLKVVTPGPDKPVAAISPEVVAGEMARVL